MEILRLDSPDWEDYALLDSGDGEKLEQFGAYRVIRPEAQAVWQLALPPAAWEAAHARFQLGDQGGWQFRQRLPARWEMHYRDLRFWVKAAPFRHLGVFPEQAAHWDWLHERIAGAGRPIRLLNLFAYTGIASLFAAAAGAEVTHVDSSKPAVAWARENQALAGLADRPIRWIVEDAIKYVEREIRRGSRYEAILLDPPPFGRGPKGEVWKFDQSLPRLLEGCHQLLSDSPLCVILTAYTTQAALSELAAAVRRMMVGWEGEVSAGTAVIIEKSAGRVLEPATFVRWGR